MEPVPALVTLHVWRVPAAAVPRAVARVGLDRVRARRTPGVRFAKLLGTGKGFGVTEADLTCWAKLTCWAAPGPDPVADAWDRLAVDRCRLSLRPLASRGRWSRREPFGSPTPSRYDGPVASLTRARLDPRRARSFWAAVPSVEAALHGSPGLTAALAVGEAPLGLQGTFSLWEDGAALTGFAHRTAEHQQAVADTATRGWYSEELFARFAVEGSEGDLQALVRGSRS